MSETRKLLEELYDTAHAEAIEADGKKRPDIVVVCQTIGRIVDRVMAEHPRAEAEAVTGLPEWVAADDDGDWIISFNNGLGFCLAPHYSPEDLDRIAEACRILAARRRAGL